MAEIFLVVALLLLNGCQLPSTSSSGRPAAYQYETWVPLSRWARTCGYPPPQRLALSPAAGPATNVFDGSDLEHKAASSAILPPTFSLSVTNGRLRLQPETRLAHWNDLSFQLGFPPKLVQGELLVHTLDLSKTIAPLLAAAPVPATHRVIVIHPAPPGAGGAGRDFTLDWAQQLSSLLASNQWTVFLTRTNQTVPPASALGLLVDSHHAALFLDLRFSAVAGDETAGGVETSCLPPAGIPSNPPSSRSEPVWRTYPNNAFDAENWAYAFRFHQALSRIPGVTDGGLHRSRFLEILHKRNAPAVSLSGGCLSNPHDAALIARPAFRKQLAEAVAGVLQ